jgi:carboxyl-terminal processing protease
VLVWKLPRFGYQDETIDRIMRQAREHRWLVLDLRDNPGGAVEAETRLLGHFFRERFVAYTERWRDSTVERWIEPQGREPYGGEVVVLLNSRSASAAEITARVLQMRGRASVVGDRSAGAVMTSYGISLTLGSIFQERVVPFGMSVTISDVIMPDGGRLEKTGVVPNIGLLPTGQDLAEKRDPAMAFALEMAGVAMNADEAGKLLRR